jgi:4-hydroxyacetophenone monooxygenase
LALQRADAVKKLTTDAVEHHQAGMSDQDLRDAVQAANIPTLLMVLTQITGDMKWLADPYTPTRSRGISDNDTAGLTPDRQREVREAAFSAISNWLHDGTCAIPVVPEDLAVRMLSHSMGEKVPEQYGPLLRGELSPDRVDPRRLGARFGDAASRFSIVIVGAGASGIAAALTFKSAGFAVTVLEQHDQAGGVWHENRYPNVGVDTPSHLYSFLWARHDWSRFFAAGEEVLEYLQRIADEFGVTCDIRFNTTVLQSVYSEADHQWTTTARRADGTRYTIKSNFVISAVGAFNPPKYPDIEGRDDFEGIAFHAARWSAIDLAGQRVAVIGNGATAMQMVPAIAGKVAQLSVFQRQPQWAAPFEKCQKPVPPALRKLIHAVPLYDLWYRIRLSWMYMDRMYDSLQRDPEWEHPNRSMNRINDRHRELFTEYIKSELQGREDLIEQLTPHYPPFGKRILLDNGWYRAMLRDNVSLVSSRISRIDKDSIYTDDGKRHEVDVIIFATGFYADRFLATFNVVGRDGISLAEAWDGDDARAYLGTVIPRFPNFMCLYGPNAQIGHGGSLITIVQFQLDYCIDLLHQFLASDGVSFEVKRQVNDEYNSTVDEMHENMIWTHPGMNTYYRNSKGRVVVVNPWRVLDYYQMTRTANLSEYEITVPDGPVVKQASPLALKATDSPALDCCWGWDPVGCLPAGGHTGPRASEGRPPLGCFRCFGAEVSRAAALARIGRCRGSRLLAVLMMSSQWSPGSSGGRSGSREGLPGRDVVGGGAEDRLVADGIRGRGRSRRMQRLPPTGHSGRSRSSCGASARPAGRVVMTWSPAERTPAAIAVRSSSPDPR